jgi:hypothetical protein
MESRHGSSGSPAWRRLDGSVILVPRGAPSFGKAGARSSAKQKWTIPAKIDAIIAYRKGTFRKWLRPRTGFPLSPSAHGH